jgi:dihydroxyacetone kinase-like protein
MEYILNSTSSVVVDDVIATIQENAAFLSEIDGLIGDGDHGINMNKSANLCKERMKGKQVDLTTALKTLSQIMLTEIGGSMGPLYGTFFNEMSKACKDRGKIDAVVFRDMLDASLAGIQRLTNAKIGDKTLIDTLVPAIHAYKKAIDDKKEFKEALKAMKVAAERGKDSTTELIAQIGRASRLGERTKGFLDPGATSCWLILQTMADSIIHLLHK